MRTRYDLSFSEVSFNFLSVENMVCWFETALDYKPRIFFGKFPSLVHKLFVILAAFEYKPQWKWGKDYEAAAYNGAHTVYYFEIFINPNMYVDKLSAFV